LFHFSAVLSGQNNAIFLSFRFRAGCLGNLVFCSGILSSLMRWLLVLSRVAFICNVFFLLAFSLQVSSWIRYQDLTDYIITIGFVMAFIINPVVNVFYLFTGILRRSRLSIVPLWLITANVLFLVIEGFYLLYINVSK
jgi:hypothetical protein